MKQYGPALSVGAITIGILALATSSQAQLINGDFESSDFTGWTYADLPTGLSLIHQVTLFDTSGSGSPSLAAQFEVGRRTTIPYGQGGAGISQSVPLSAGRLTLSVDIAAWSQHFNGDAGTFNLLLDGTTVVTHSFGAIGFNETLRSTLEYSSDIAAGTHLIEIDMLRGYYAGGTPYQYLDNIELSVSQVPEPSISALVALGALTLMYARRHS